MKFTRTTYPDYPGAQGSPCWKLEGRWIDIDADWNTHFPFGTSFGLHIGRQPPPVAHKPECKTDCHCDVQPNRAPGFLLDLNAPIGEPNRLYLWLGHWHVTLGLISWHTFRETGRRGHVIEGAYVRCRPHLDGISRYRYHQDETGQWVRNGKPDPLHWGWLTIERRR